MANAQLPSAMNEWSPYRDILEAPDERTSLSVRDVVADDDLITASDAFATGRYRAQMVGSFLQYFDCDLRTTNSLHAEGRFVPGICVGQRFEGRWSSEIGTARIDMDEGSDLVAYGSGSALNLLESQPADTKIRMAALYIGADFFDSLPCDERPPSAMLSLIGRNDLAPRKLGRSPALRALFRQMYANMCQSYIAQIQMCGLALAVVAELAACLDETPRTGRPSSRQRDLAHAAREFLDGNAATLPPMPELAARFATNESSLRRAFKAEFGVPITEYVRNRLLEEARLYIREGQLQIAEIAWRFGFSDPANFTTAYRRRFGHPPRSDRARN